LLHANIINEANYAYSSYIYVCYVIEPWHRLSRTRKNIEVESQELAS
jgi:hypothetical protein